MVEAGPSNALSTGATLCFRLKATSAARATGQAEGGNLETTSGPADSVSMVTIGVVVLVEHHWGRRYGREVARPDRGYLVGYGGRWGDSAGSAPC